MVVAIPAVAAVAASAAGAAGAAGVISTTTAALISAGLTAAGAAAGAVSMAKQSKVAEANDRLNASLANTRALQKDTQSRAEMERVGGAINAARAANGLSLNSPTARAFHGDANRILTTDRRIAVADERQRASNFLFSAKQNKRNARSSLFSGAVQAAIPLAQYGIGQFNASTPFKANTALKAKTAFKN